MYGGGGGGVLATLYSGTLNPTGQMVALAWPSFHLGEVSPSARLPVLLGLQARNPATELQALQACGSKIAKS